MKLKLNCTLQLKTSTQTEPVAEDINIIEIADDAGDEHIRQFFDVLRINIKKKYVNEIFNYFDVEFREIKE